MAILKHLAPIREFVESVLRHEKVLVTSSVLVLLVGIAQNFSPAGHRILFVVLYVATLVIGFFVAFYRAWDEQRLEKEKAIAALPGTLSREWKELENRFTQLINFGVRAQYFHHCLNRRDVWDFQGASSLYTDQLESLSEMAGKLLIASGRIQLPAETNGVINNQWRWLYFVKATYSYLGEFEEAAEITEDNKEHTIIMWHAHDVAQLSAQACLKCAALEL
jgi:hypothetical protein